MTRIKLTLIFIIALTLAPAIVRAEPTAVPVVDGIVVVDEPAVSAPAPASFMQALWLTLQPALLLLISGSVATFVPLLLSKLNTWAKSKVHDARFHCAMDKINSWAETAVLDISQTYVAGVRRRGEWGGESAEEAKRLAKAKLLELMGPAGLAEAKGCLGQTGAGLDGSLDSAIEAALVKAKPLMGLPAAQAAAVPVLDVSADQPTGSAASTK